MKIVLNPAKKTWPTLMKRPQIAINDMDEIVEQVFNEVSENGDNAVKAFTQQYDKVTVNQPQVSLAEINAAPDSLDKPLKKAIQTAAKNINAFHEGQQLKEVKVETTPGVTCWQVARPIETVGIYIPGGTAPLFSTVLMLAIPALIAGCKQVVLCTPPNKEGAVHPAILYAAKITGVKVVFKVGGIQAIAAMAMGTALIPKVNKILGPGNQFVTAAKQYAQKLGTAIDMPAGPSELLVMADETATLDFVAADLISQAEHGEDSQVIALINAQINPEELVKAVNEQLAVLPRRIIAKKALESSRIIMLNSIEDRIQFVNHYAPEHLIIAEKNPVEILDKIKNAGSVFLGNYTPESAGDYASGTNHTLPTNGFSKAYSGVNLDCFQKKITVQHISEKGIVNLAETVETMAEAEELIGHKNAVSIRLKNLKSCL